jgi:hypothetical protein
MISDKKQKIMKQITICFSLSSFYVGCITNLSFSHNKLSRGWYAIECCFQQFTKNLLCLKWLWFFFQKIKFAIQMLVMCNFITQHNRIWHTYSIEENFSWEAKWFSASQEISRILWNLKVHYFIQKCPISVPILSFSIQNLYHDMFLQ